MVTQGSLFACSALDIGGFMGRFHFRTALTDAIRIGLVLVLAVGLVAGFTPAFTTAAMAQQGPPSSPASSAGLGFYTLTPATDAQSTLVLWQKGGEFTRSAARAALLGNDSQLDEFITSGQYTALTQDYRSATILLSLVGRSTTRAAAETALADGRWNTLQLFLTDGWKQAWLTDDYKDTAEAATKGTATVKKAAQKALDAGDASVQLFMAKGKSDADYIDKQKQVASLLAGSPSVEAGANAALDAFTPEALDDFLRYGQFVAAARDAESATVSQLATQAKSASDQAVVLNAQAQTAADQAANAARLAKVAAQKAANEAAAAGISAAKAGDAAMRAASLADQAARAAQVAVSAASEAREALSQAANAATNAAAAAARAEQAASGALGAAGAAAGNAGQAAAARAAAQNARDAAKGAKSAADAAGFAADATTASSNAANSAASAGRNAAAAAQAAAAAAGESGVSQEQADVARAAADRASAAAARAEQASADVTSLASQVAFNANLARTAALEAATHANNAANSADEAADHAGNAATAAQKTAQYAAAAQTAANAAAAAVVKAGLVRDLARKADTDRLAAEREYKMAQARDDRELEDTQKQDAAKNKADAQTAADSTASLVAALTAPGANLDTQSSELKAAVFGLMETGGPWEKASAELALVSGNAGMKEFIVSGLVTAREQDQWDQAMGYTSQGSLPVRIAAQDALYSGEEDVAEFLNTTRWELNKQDYLKEAATYLIAGGPEVKKAANQAIDAGTTIALRDFLDSGRASAALIDDRKAIAGMLATAKPELKVAAEVALEGPDSYLSAFLSTGRLEATKRDQESDAHLAHINQLIAKATANAATARQAAANAAEAAARARQSASEAQQYADQARQHASDAKASATEAATFASQAQQSADQAAQSEITAKAAATQARNDAITAHSEAAKAVNSAVVARSAASQAAAASASAQADASQAGMDAAQAAEAATDAWVTAATKKKEEDETANLVKANTGDLDADESKTEMDIARAAGGEAAAQELKAARDALAQGDVMQMIIKEGGQLLLDFFGVTDVLNCVTKSDFGACAMALVGILPWGKVFKAVEAIALLTKIIPKIVLHFNKITNATKIIEKYAGKLNSALIKKGDISCPISRSTCGMQSNPALHAIPSKNPNTLGQFGNDSMAAAGFKPSKKPEHGNGLEVSYTVKKADGKEVQRRADGIDEAGNIWENKNAARLGGAKNKAQMEDAIAYLEVTGGKKVKLQVRCHPDGTQITVISSTIKSIKNYTTKVEVGCIPASIPI